MYVFLDDSGDAGMKFTQGSSEYLVIAACIFNDGAQVEKTAKTINSCRTGLGHGEKWEFKHAKTTTAEKDAFFEILPHCDFAVRAIVIDKKMLMNDPSLSHMNQLKNFAIVQLLTHTDGTVHNAKLVIDGKNCREFGVTNPGYFRKMINQCVPETISKVTFADSQRNMLIQLADMIAGAIHRSHRSDRKQPSNHMAAISQKARPPLGKIWQFN